MLETRKQERLEQGEFRTDDGQVVIDEDEYELPRKVKDLKSRYRRDYEDLLNTKDEQEKFDRLQLELLMEHPDSVPYYNAKMQTERRMHLTASGGQKKRKPGTLIATVRNKPPTTLTVT